MRRNLSFALVLLLIGIFSCKKEESLENSKTGTSSGSLQADATNECLPKTVQGVYVAGVSLGSTNFIEVDIDVDLIGSYFITTDTINGYYFSGSGNFSATGINTVKLSGKGKPLAQGGDFFTVDFDSTSCNVAVTVLPATAGAPAVFTLQTSGTNCMDASVSGDYTKGVVLNSTNKVTVKVNVTTIGSYSISTTATNGMTFSASGAFSTTGVQTVTLTGSGTPVNSGAISIPLTVGSTTCSFPVTVNATATNPPPAGTYIWKFTSGGKITHGEVDGDGVLEVVSSGAFSFTTIAFFGISAAVDTSIVIAIADLNNVVNANETYVSTSTTSNSAGIEIDYGGVTFYADPQTPTASVTVKVTSHNTTTKVIAGTFSGTLKDQTGAQTLTITNGEFNFHYQ